MLNSLVYSDHENKLHTKPYSKPCDDHTYLVPTSCHPTHNLRNIPYGIGHTIYKIASEPHEYVKSKQEYTTYLTARGYNHEIILKDFEKLETKDRLSYLEPKDKHKPEERIFPLVTEFNPGLPNIGSILNKHKHILHLDSELTKIINPDNIFASYRGTKTIKDLLIHSKLPSLRSHSQINPTGSDTQSEGCHPCKKLCNLCKNYLIKTVYSYSHQTNSRFKIKNYIDCDTKYVIYVFNDNICKISSVGYTADCMKVRFPNHKSHIKHNRRTCEISKHFADNLMIHELDKSTNLNYDNSLKSQIEVIIIEKVDMTGIDLADTDLVRRRLKEREWFWQNNLKTLRQYGGLNVREERPTSINP